MFIDFCSANVVLAQVNDAGTETTWVGDFIRLAMFLVPFLLVAVAIHFLEQVIQRRLSRRFGWNSILMTGWLGTPIHEMSHAVMCYTFRHKIDELALFKPDMESGRLGYVRHSYQKGNWIQEIGNVFIGIAPMIGGTLALSVLLWFFYPTVAGELFSFESSDSTRSLRGEVAAVCGHAFAEIFTLENLRTFRFWIFIYLVLCVSSHMAPSFSDYAGAGRGFALIGIVLLGVAAILTIGGFADETSLFLKQLSRPIIVVFSLSLILCFVAAIIVFVFTAIWDVFF